MDMSIGRSRKDVNRSRIAAFDTDLTFMPKKPQDETGVPRKAASAPEGKGDGKGRSK